MSPPETNGSVSDAETASLCFLEYLFYLSALLTVEHYPAVSADHPKGSRRWFFVIFATLRALPLMFELRQHTRRYTPRIYESNDNLR